MQATEAIGFHGGACVYEFFRRSDPMRYTCDVIDVLVASFQKTTL